MRLFDVTVGGEQFSVTQHDDGTFSMPPELEKWKGHNVALKPAFEPVVVARKPLAKGLTVAQNVQQFGTGALNIDATRIRVSDTDDIHAKNPHTSGGFGHGNASVYGTSAGANPYDPTAGRWPANVALDSESAAALDQMSGTLTSGKMHPTRPKSGNRQVYGQDAAAGYETMETYGDSGGASRFFLTAEPDAPDLPIDELAERFMYCAKAPKSERPTYVKEGSGNGRVITSGKIRECNVCASRTIRSGEAEPACGHGDYRWTAATKDATKLRLRSDLTPEQVDLVRARLAEVGVRVD